MLNKNRYLAIDQSQIYLFVISYICYIQSFLHLVPPEAAFFPGSITFHSLVFL